MPKVRYSLQTPKEPESLIRMVFRYEPHKLVFYPGYKVRSADWNSKEMRLRKTGAHAQEINAGLSRLSAEAERVFLEYKGRGEFLSVSRFRELVNQFWNGVEPKRAEELDLIGYTNKYIQERLDAGKKYNSTAI